MTKLNENDLIIEIDERIAMLIEEINTKPATSTVDFVESLRSVMIDAVLGPFGLSNAVFADQDGGNITTNHNFQEGITANEADRERHGSWQKAQQEPFDRAGRSREENYDHQLKTERKKLLQSEDVIIDAYTGKALPKDGRAHRDHVVPAAEVERSSKAQLAMDRSKRVKSANSDENLVWTDSGLNQSAGMKDKKLWAQATKNRDGVEVSNAEYFDVDMERLRTAHDQAHKRIDSAENLALLKKQAGEFFREGGTEAGKLATRQLIGLILKDLAAGLIDDVKQVIRDGFQSVEQLVEVLDARLQAMVERIKTKWSAYLLDGASAGFAGLISSLVTALINSFLTTAKRVVTIIRELTLAIVSSIKLIVHPPQGTTGKEIAIEVLKLLSGAAVVAATLMLQEAVAKAIEAVPLFAPFAQDIASVLVAILGGAMGLMTILAFDRLKSHIAFQNKSLADVHRGHAIGFLKIQRIRVVIDRATCHVSDTSMRLEMQIADGWASIKDQSSKADDAISGYAESVGKLKKLSERDA